MLKQYINYDEDAKRVIDAYIANGYGEQNAYECFVHDKSPKESTVKEESTNGRTEETVPDSGNAESGRGVAEKDAAGKGSNREEIRRKIQEILRKSSIKRNDNSIDGGRSNRVERKETKEAFEKRACDEWYMYAAYGVQSFDFRTGGSI